MNWLIWPGAIVAVIGVFGLVYCIRAAAMARREKLDDGAMKSKLCPIGPLFSFHYSLRHYVVRELPTRTHSTMALKSVGSRPSGQHKTLALPIIPWPPRCGR